MTNADIKFYAAELHQVLSDISDKRLEGKAILEAAKAAGINTKALAKVAKEMLKDSDKLRDQYESERQLDLFRVASGLLKMKGLDDLAQVAEETEVA